MFELRVCKCYPRGGIRILFRHFCYVFVNVANSNLFVNSNKLVYKKKTIFGRQCLLILYLQPSHQVYKQLVTGMTLTMRTYQLAYPFDTEHIQRMRHPQPLQFRSRYVMIAVVAVMIGAV